MYFLNCFKVTAKLFSFWIPVESVITLIVYIFFNKIDQITVILIINEPETFAGTLKSTRFADASDQPAQLLLCSSLSLLFLRIINAYQRPLLSLPSLICELYPSPSFFFCHQSVMISSVRRSSSALTCSSFWPLACASTYFCLSFFFLLHHFKLSFYDLFVSCYWQKNIFPKGNAA